jgi:2-polyprenyl-3-methyl-5-hydroxy-6-metoxy-1,4-benzoquinol methylase
MLNALTASNDPARRIEISLLASELYPSGPLLMRTMQHYRPYISPFGSLIDLVPQGSRVLDIGCGGGLLLGLLNHFDRINYGLGIDTSAPAIAQANEMQRRSSSAHRLQFICMDASEPLPDGPFDVVSLIDVMHHIHPDHQYKVLRKAIERVAPGGILLYKDMVKTPRSRALANRLHDLLIARQWINYLPIEDTMRWAQQSGCSILTKGGINMLWYGHEWVVFRRG